MTLKSLVTLLEKRKLDIQLKLQEASGIYTARSTSHFSGTTSDSTPSAEDRLRLFALENERLRAFLKSLKDQSEEELTLINSALIELGNGNQDNRKLTIEVDRLKEDKRVLEAKLAARELDKNSLNDQIAKFESLLQSERTRSSDLQSKMDQLKRDLENAQSTADQRRSSNDIEQLLKNKINILEKSVRDLKDEKEALKMDNMQLGFRITDLQGRSAQPIKLEVKTSEANHGQQGGSERKIIEAIDVVKEDMRNFNKTQKEILDKIREEKDQKSSSMSQEFNRNRNKQGIEFNAQRSWYRNNPHHADRDAMDPHLELSLNLPPDFDQFDPAKGSHLKKMKQVIKLLTERQTQSIKTLEEKTEKIKELKKANKELTRELDVLKAENRTLKADESKLDAQLRKLKDELEKLRVERDRGVETQAKLQKKVEKLERKIRELRESEQRIQSLEKQKELMLTVNNQRNEEIQSLLNELNDKQDALNHVVSRSQINPDVSQYDDSSSGLRSRYLKLKGYFRGLREAYFQLQNDYATLAAELEKEVKLRETILEDFLKRSDFFENKITEFREFPDRLIDVKRLIVSKRLDA